MLTLSLWEWSPPVAIYLHLPWKRMQEMKTYFRHLIFAPNWWCYKDQLKGRKKKMCQKKKSGFHGRHCSQFQFFWWNRKHVLMVHHHQAWTGLPGLKDFFFFCLTFGMWEFQGPGIKPVPQQWQCWILNPLSHQGTPRLLELVQCCDYAGMHQICSLCYHVGCLEQKCLFAIGNLGSAAADYYI